MAAALGADKAQLTLKKLDELRVSFEDVLAKDENQHKRLDDLIKARKSKKRSALVTASSVEGQSVKKLRKLLDKCKKELPAGDSLVQQVLANLEARQKSHRVPLANEVDKAEKLTLRELDALEKRCCVELQEDDSVYITLKEITNARVKSHKEPLIKLYKEYVNKVKTVSVVDLSNFVKDAEKELPPHDALLGQVLALQKAKVLNKTGGSKSKAKVISKERKRKKSSKRDAATADRDLERGDPLKPSSPSFLSAVRADISGANDSSVYKLTLVSVFILYAALMYYTMQLVFQVSPFTLNDVVESIIGADAAATEEPQQQNPPPNVIDPQAGVN